MSRMKSQDSQARYPGIIKAGDGNAAVVAMETAASEAAGAYPITPATPMGEGWADAAAAGVKKLVLVHHGPNLEIEENRKRALEEAAGPFDGEVIAAGYALHRFEGLNNEPDMEAPWAYHHAGRPDRTAEPGP